MNADVQRYLTTLRRIPPDVVRRMATREFNMLNDDSRCVCGWAIREALDDAVGRLTGTWSTDLCQQEFGGDFWEWAAIYHGVTDLRLPFIFIEEAFARRVAECCP